MSVIASIIKGIKLVVSETETIIVDAEDIIAGKPLPATASVKAQKMATILKDLISIVGTVEAVMASPELQAALTALAAL